jgi:transcriptional regulator with XRE-family HTH domain
MRGGRYSLFLAAIALACSRQLEFGWIYWRKFAKMITVNMKNDTFLSINGAVKMEIGATIRAIRKKKGITIGQLCEETGLSQGFLSLVENNKTSPSLATLDAIAAVLQVPAAFLLLKQEERMKVVRKDERTHSMYKDQLKVAHLGEEAGLRLLMIEIPPGPSANLDTNVHEGVECHLVLKGRLLARQGEDEFILEEGDSFSWKSFVPHYAINIGDEPAIVLIASYSDSRKTT